MYSSGGGGGCRGREGGGGGFLSTGKGGWARAGAAVCGWAATVSPIGHRDFRVHKRSIYRAGFGAGARAQQLHRVGCRGACEWGKVVGGGGGDKTTGIARTTTPRWGVSAVAGLHMLSGGSNSGRSRRKANGAAAGCLPVTNVFEARLKSRSHQPPAGRRRRAARDSLLRLRPMGGGACCGVKNVWAVRLGGGGARCIGGGPE